MKIFISHQRSDKDKAKKVASFLQRCGIDVYFDEFDNELQNAMAIGSPKLVVAAIRKGVQQCTHMLVIVSPNTLLSLWVPFEIGYGYDNTRVMALTLKGIKSTELPEYLRTVPIIRDIYDLDKYAKEYGILRLMESQRITKEAGYSSHPLSSVMDFVIT